MATKGYVNTVWDTVCQLDLWELWNNAVHGHSPVQVYIAPNGEQIISITNNLFLMTQDLGDDYEVQFLDCFDLLRRWRSMGNCLSLRIAEDNEKLRLA